MIPSTKISQTILEFGKSIILQLPENPTKDEYEAAISIVVVAWNAVVMDAWGKVDKFEKEIISRLESGEKKALVEVKRLIKRKKSKFGADPRAVGNYWVRESDAGEFVFGCEARLDVENAPANGVNH